jgi:hypothetical protein
VAAIGRHRLCRLEEYGFEMKVLVAAAAKSSDSFAPLEFCKEDKRNRLRRPPVSSFTQHSCFHMYLGLLIEQI